MKAENYFQNMTNIEEAKNDNYIVKIASKRIEKELGDLPRKEYFRVSATIKSLADNPRPYGVKKLSDRVHRVRIGNYRVVYSIFDKERIVLIDKVAKRSESTYKKI